MRPAGTVLLMLISAAGVLDKINGEPTGDCTIVKGGNCENGYKEIYKEQYMHGKRQVTEKQCCTKDSDKAKSEEINARACKVTSCLDPKTSGTEGEDFCAEFRTRWVNGNELLDYKEAVRDSCSLGDKKVGVEVLCCPQNSKEGMLTLLLGAEKHQFPHYALIHAAHWDGGMSYCGGTIYNELWIITASHCIVQDGKLRPTEGSSVMLDVRISNYNTHAYDVEQFIAHPNSTKWNPNHKRAAYNDVGLIKLKKKINFGPNVKALPIAKTGFNPFKYSNETVIIGVGVTDADTSIGARLLQRARTFLRRDEDNMYGHFKNDMLDGVLFVGGMQLGTTGAVAGQGDSGGPAICRDEKGYAIMCGLSSSAAKLPKCENYLNSRYCTPSHYMEAQHYYEWFVSIAGDQSNAEVLKMPLFGAPVKDGKFEHQVHITTKDGPTCGGTLIEKDIVVSSAHCVVDDDGNNRQEVKVFTGVRDLNLDKGRKMDVSGIRVLDGFQRNQGTRGRRLARLNVLPTPKYPYYKNDLALLKLSSKADISSKKLPKIGPAPESGDDADDVVWTTEVSYPTDTSRSGSLQQRDFHILEHRTCQNRMNRAGYAGYDIQVDENILCGEEMYNGGAQCDRELGGGLICKGKDGKDVLCGVQVFRFCQLALPSAFLNINQYKDWVEQTKSQM